MLKKLRNKKFAKKVWIILAVIIVPAFVLWGSGSLSRSKQTASYAGKIFGKKIPLSEYLDALDAVKNNMKIQYGDRFQEIEKSLNLEYRGWERLILLYEARKRKITASDQEVIELIGNYHFFQRNGKFDNKTYTEILQYVFHAQSRVFEEQIRQNIILSKLYKQVTENVKVSDKEIKEEYRKLNEEISLHYIASCPADFAKQLKPAEEEIKDYFAKNSLQFKRPFSFNLDYITMESEDKIKGVAQHLNKKADFAKVAKDAALSVKETGLFAQTEPIPGIGWSPEILSLVSKLKIGQYTPIVRFDKTYYILRLKETKEPYIPEFEKVKDNVKEVFIKDRANKAAENKIKGCLEKLKLASQQNPDSIDFIKVAKECALKSGSTPRFKFDGYLEGIGATDTLWTAADTLKTGNFSEIVRMPSGFYVIKLNERIPIDEKKFETEKEEFSHLLLLQKRQENFFKFTEELKIKAQ